MEPIAQALTLLALPLSPDVAGAFVPVVGPEIAISDPGAGTSSPMARAAYASGV
jgi:hypothetical protein